MKILFYTSLFLLFSACGIQSIPKAKNALDAATAEVTNQYKRRADLIPNLVETVKGFAEQEKETLTAVVEARAKATQTKISVDDPSSLTKFSQAQGELSQALGRLMMVSERYPDLKSNQNFRDLQAQLEGSENRITVARNRLIEAIKLYNNEITVPPSSFTNSLFYGYEKLPQWTVENAKEIEEAPKVSF